MQAPDTLMFPPFQMDLADERLRHGQQVLRLTHKAFAVLKCLVTHPGQLVTKDDLFTTVWPETVVSESVLTGCVYQLRQALGDQARNPRFIETVHGRGYRFIAPIAETAPSTQPLETEAQSYARRASSLSSSLILVGREVEQAQLNQWFTTVRSSERQVGFITGEAGIGKTALIEDFVTRVSAAEEVWIGHGQCIDHYGEREAYLPVLEALGRLCRGTEGAHWLAFLRQYAPSWLVQMPALLSREERQTLQRELLGTTRARMLREMAEALEILTLEKPLILVLEDLHWSDDATLDLITVLARRQEPARLLLIGTYRPADALLHEHPVTLIKQELELRQQCGELPLPLLTEAGVSDYLDTRLGTPKPVSFPRLARLLHQRTDGNPLFIVHGVNALIESGMLVHKTDGWYDIGEETIDEIDVPETLQQLITHQVARLSKNEQYLLQAASAVGVDFSTAVVAAALTMEDSDIEQMCEGLVRRQQFLQRTSMVEWPDGTPVSCYRFVHTMYREVLYQRMLSSDRFLYHQRIGQRLETAYGRRAGNITAELAVHFTSGRQYAKAVRYHQLAGVTAIQRHAYREAIKHLVTGLDLLKLLPDTLEQLQHELKLQVALGTALLAMKGLADEEVGNAYVRARTLCEQLEDHAQLFVVLWGLWGNALLCSELQTARDFAQQRLELAQQQPEPIPLLLAHLTLGITLFYLGELHLAHTHIEQSMALYDPTQYHAYARLEMMDPGVTGLTFSAWLLWLRGYPDQAQQRNQQALALAQRIAYPYSEAQALAFSSWLRHLSRNVEMALDEAESVIALSREYGFVQWAVLGSILQGWGLVQIGQREQGIEQAQQMLAAYRASGCALSLTYALSLLAEAYTTAKHIDAGLATLTEALIMADTHDERYYEAELYRLKGDLLQYTTSSSPQSEWTPEAYFLKALEIARQQQAKALELRAAMSLGRLWQHQGQSSAARQLLAEVYNWFTEGFDTADLLEAKALLETWER